MKVTPLVLVAIMGFPSYAKPPPGMTYLVFRTTGDRGSSYRSGTGDPLVVTLPGSVEYLGTFGGTSHYEALCADATGSGPQSLYLIPAPIEREIPTTESFSLDPDWRLIEGDYAKALPGQKMNLLLQDKYLNNYGPWGVTLDTFIWTIPDKTFRAYDPDPEPHSNHSNYFDLVDSDLSSTQVVHFYWADSGKKEPAVNFQVKIDGSQVGDGVTQKLDTRYPYYQDGSAPANGMQIRGAGDSPSEPTQLWKSINIQESFETYQMFCPPGIDSCYVPLKRITWNWNAVSSSSNNWELGTSSGAVVDPTGGQFSEHPKWNANSKEDQ